MADRVGPKEGRWPQKKLKVYNRVRVLREEAGVSRREMAEDLGIAYRTLGYIEREQYTPSLPMAWRVAGYFDLPLDAVFSPEPMEAMHRELYHRPAKAVEGGV